MQKQVSFLKPAIDLFWVQLTWIFWALGVILTVHIGRIFFASNIDSFYSAGYIAGNLYMLIIGIIAINFLPYYVENGITRKHYFIGNVIASVGLSIFIPILTYIISLLEKLILTNFTSLALNDRVLEEVVVDVDGNVIGEIIQSIILTPFVHPESNLVLSLALFSVHIFIFYIIGWMIGAAFYRLGVIGGILFIAISLVLTALKDSMIRLALDIPLLQNFSAFDIVPERFALALVFAVGLITIIFIRLLTKRAPINI